MNLPEPAMTAGTVPSVCAQPRAVIRRASDEAAT